MSAQAGSQEAKDRMAKARAAKAKPVRARPARADTRLRERRKRTDGSIDRMAQFTLDIFEKEQLPPGYVCRWVEDTGARMRIAHKEDYDPVMADEIKDFDPDSTDSEGGGVVRQIVGRRDNGHPIYATLMKKPQEWFDADQAAGVKRRTEMLEGRVLHGQTGQVGDHDAPVENAYVPEGVQVGTAAPGRDMGFGRKVGPVGQV